MVRFLSTSTIRTTTAHNDSIRRIELTPWDLQHLMVGYIQRGLFALDIFYPLAGRLAMIENKEKIGKCSFKKKKSSILPYFLN